jgi:ketosteroid isomerase-like protein
MESPNVEVVRLQFEALENGGVDAAARFWHPDIEWRAVEGAVDDIGVISGRDAMRRYYQDWLEMIDDLRGGIEEVVYDSGETLVAILYNSGRGRGSSVPIRGRYTVVYTIRDGLIVRGREYETQAQALEAARLLESD